MLGTIDLLQELLDPKSKFAVGDNLTLADATVAPFLISLYTMSKPEMNVSFEGEMGKLLAALKDEKYARFSKYAEAVIAHPTVVKTFDEVCLPTGCRVVWRH